MASHLAFYHNGGLRTSSKATTKQAWNLFGKIGAKRAE